MKDDSKINDNNSESYAFLFIGEDDTSELELPRYMYTERMYKLSHGTKEEKEKLLGKTLAKDDGDISLQP